MVQSKDLKISILLNGGINNRTARELVSPIPQQGTAPPLVASTNTRLSKTPGTAVRSPSSTQVLATARGKWGVVPSANSERAIMFNPIGGRHHILSGTGSESTGQGEFIPVEPQDAYFPTQIIDAGALDESYSTDSPPAIGHNSTSGLVWRAYRRPHSGTLGSVQVTVSCWTFDGRKVADIVAAASFTDGVAVKWIGITCHGATGDRVWYTSGNGICYRTITVSGATITVGSEVIVAVPGQLLTAGVAVVSGDAGFAYLVHSTVGHATNGTIRKVNISTGATTASTTFGAVLNGGGHCCVHYGTLGGVTRIAFAFSCVTGSITNVNLVDTSLITVGATTNYTAAGNGLVACKFEEDTYYGTSQVVFFVSNLTTDTISSNPGAFISGGAQFCGTRTFTCIPGTWGSAVAANSIPWMVMLSHGVQWSKDGQQRAIMFMGRHMGGGRVEPGTASYVDDNCVVAFNVCNQRFLPIATFGNVRGIASPADATPVLMSNSNAVINGDQVVIAYTKATGATNAVINNGAADQVTGRYVTLDLSENQPSVVNDKDGAGLTAGAQPVQWDGALLSELSGPAFRPHVANYTGVGVTQVAGVYRMAAVYLWRDATGAIHRSRPSAIVTKTCDGATDKLNIVVSLPHGLLRMQPSQYLVRLYLSATNGTTLHHYAEQYSSRNSSTHGVMLFEVASTTGADTAQPQIYTNGGAGEEIGAQIAPPLRDIAIIGSRAWGVDAEFPTRLVYSKLRIAGAGYEFFSAGEVNLPSGAGDAYAVREWQGLTVAFCERGVYQIAGDGPNNNNSGGSFATPVKVSDIGCTNTASVVAYPGGIIWQSGSRFAMLSGAGVAYVPDFDCTVDVSTALLMRRYDEVAFFNETTVGVRVYNYATQRWTEWDSQTLAAAVSNAVTLPWDEDTAFLFSRTASTTRRLDVNSVSAAGSLTVETDWVLLSGDFQDHVRFRSIVFDAYYAGAHSLTIEMYVDYSTTPQTYTWTSAEITTLAGSDSRYSVRLEPREQNGRAVKFKIYDTLVSGGGMNPKNLTLYYAIDGEIYQEKFATATGAYKG